MIHRHLPNLCSSELVDGPAPWEFTDLSLVPEKCFTDKAARDKWINTPSTQYHVYNPFEGVNPHLRVRSPKGTDEGNPPVLQNYLSVDCDVAYDVETAEKSITRMGEMKPAWFEQTLSGNGRFFWLFETPIQHINLAAARFFLDKCGELFPLNCLMGVDLPALTTPSRYYTNGARWTHLSDYVVPASRLTGFTMKIMEKFNWKSRELGKAASIDKVREECKKRFPGFSRWEGEFSIGAQGPSFWLEGSLSPKSAIVRDTGMHTFAEHSAKPFYSWAELVGKEFVENDENDRLGEVVNNYFYDGAQYFCKDADGNWLSEKAENVKLALRKLLSTQKPKGIGLSEAESAFHQINIHQRVERAVPVTFFPKGLLKINGKKVLNTHSRDALQPAAKAGPWGAEGSFPTLSRFLDGFFSSDEQLEYLRTRWKIAYKGCLERKPVSGHGLVICGAPGVGKTFLTRVLIGGSMGGFAEAGPYLCGKTDFNSEIFDAGVWAIDDQSSLSDMKVHRQFTENTKQAIANPEHRVNGKFQKGGVTTWCGLLALTCNADEEGLRNIPNLEASNRDKFVILRTNDAPEFVFPPFEEIVQMVRRELPHLLAWLLEYTPPTFVTDGGANRFGMNSYCEPGLFGQANAITPSSTFSELLVPFLREFFRENPSKDRWVGTSTQLRKEMGADIGIADLLRPYDALKVGKMLGQLRQKNMFPIESRFYQGTHVWVIHFDERFGLPKRNNTPETPGSQFKKE